MTKKVAVITGGGRGIGRQTALRLARAGYDIVTVARTAQQLDQTQQMVAEAGAHCACITADLTRPGEVEKLIRTAVDANGRVDVLINNAGIAANARIEETAPETFEQMAAINMHAVFHACRTVWPVMRAQDGGTIITLSSLASFDPFPGFAAYGASKAWVNLFTKAAACEGRPDNIRVFAVAPGAVDTEMLRGPFPDFPSDQALDPDDVAALIETLLDPRCAHASGSTIPVQR